MIGLYCTASASVCLELQDQEDIDNANDVLRESKAKANINNDSKQRSRKIM